MQTVTGARDGGGEGHLHCVPDPYGSETTQPLPVASKALLLHMG